MPCLRCLPEPHQINSTFQSRKKVFRMSTARLRRHRWYFVRTVVSQRRELSVFSSRAVPVTPCGTGRKEEQKHRIQIYLVLCKLWHISNASDIPTARTNAHDAAPSRAATQITFKRPEASPSSQSGVGKVPAQKPIKRQGLSLVAQRG